MSAAALAGSPCTKVCVVDPASGLCIGCGRTLGEIAGWAGMTPDEQRAVNATLPGRMALLTPQNGRACAVRRRRD